MPTNEIITETIAKLTKRIEEIKTQIGEVDTRSTMAYNTSGKLAEVIADLARQISDMKKEINELKSTRSVTTTTPPTADGTGLPGFVVLDTKPETEYQNYVYIYPRDQK